MTAFTKKRSTEKRLIGIGVTLRSDDRQTKKIVETVEEVLMGHAKISTDKSVLASVARLTTKSETLEIVLSRSDLRGTAIAAQAAANQNIDPMKLDELVRDRNASFELLAGAAVNPSALDVTLEHIIIYGEHRGFDELVKEATETLRSKRALYDKANEEESHLRLGTDELPGKESKWTIRTRGIDEPACSGHYNGRKPWKIFGV